MGTSMIVSIGPVAANTLRNRKPRRLYRGVLRTMIRKVLARLKSIQNTDIRMYNRGLELGQPSLSVMGEDNSVVGRAFAKVIARLQECLDAVEGDE